MEFWLEVAAKYLTYAALLLLIGTLSLRWILLPRLSATTHDDLAFLSTTGTHDVAGAQAATDRTVVAVSVVLACSLLLRAVAHTVGAFGLEEGWSGENFTLITMESQWGAGWRQQMIVAAAVVLFASWGLIGTVGRLGTIAGTLVLCFLMPTLGHAAGEPDRVAIHGMHIVAGGLWLGTLTAITTARHPEVRIEQPRLLHAFAPVAMTGVALLVATGTFASITYVGSLSNVWSTEYGRLLAVKLFLVLDTLALGGLNWFYPHRRRQAPGAGILIAEVATAAAIVLVTAWLTETGHP